MVHGHGVDPCQKLGRKDSDSLAGSAPLTGNDSLAGSCNAYIFLLANLASVPDTLSSL